MHNVWRLSIIISILIPLAILAASDCTACSTHQLLAQQRMQPIIEHMLSCPPDEAVQSIAFVQSLFKLEQADSTRHDAQKLINGLRWISLYKYQQQPERALWSQGSYMLIPSSISAEKLFSHLRGQRKWYTRLSSHVPSLTVGWPRGLDVPLGHNTHVIGKYYTVLMHMLKNNRVFVKPEDHPTHPSRPWGMIKHGFQLVTDIANNYGLGTVFSQDPLESPWFAKEQIGLKHPEFLILTQAINRYMPPDHGKQLLSQIKTHGLALLTAGIQEYIENHAHPEQVFHLSYALQAAKSFVDHHHDRICRETMLYEHDIMQVPASCDTIIKLQQVLTAYRTSHAPTALCTDHAMAQAQHCNIPVAPSCC